MSARKSCRWPKRSHDRLFGFEKNPDGDPAAGRIRQLRREVDKQRLDPNVWYSAPRAVSSSQRTGDPVSGNVLAAHGGEYHQRQWLTPQDYGRRAGESGGGPETPKRETNEGSNSRVDASRG